MFNSQGFLERQCMADNFSLPLTLKDWLKLQQDYWGWSLDRDSKSISSPWLEALDGWWQVMAASLTPDNLEIASKFIEQGKNYSFFGEDFIKVFKNFELSGAEWLDNSFTELKANFATLLTNKKVSLGFGGEAWQQASLSSWSCELLRLFKLEEESHEGAKILTGNGWPQRMQERLRLWTAYQKAQEEYFEWLGKIGMSAIDLLHDKLFELHQQGKNMASLRGLYNLWVECSEEVYAKIAKGDEYSEVQARLLNAVMALKYFERKLIEEMLCALNMPTRTEMDATNLLMQQLKREIKALQQADLVSELRKEVETLRHQLETLEKPRKKATSKKKVTTPNLGK